jgi:hypothetical protein
MARSVDDVMAFPFTIAEVGQVCATVDVDHQRFMQTGTDRLTYSAAPPRIELISDERGASMAMHWRRSGLQAIARGALVRATICARRSLKGRMNCENADKVSTTINEVFVSAREGAEYLLSVFDWRVWICP